jgi:hypothetical protein
MAKKDFKSGLDSLFQNTVVEENVENSIKSVQTEKPIKTEIRATFILEENQLEILKAIAYWERKQIKEVLSEALESYFKSKNNDELEVAVTKFIKNKK